MKNKIDIVNVKEFTSSISIHKLKSGFNTINPQPVSTTTIQELKDYLLSFINTTPLRTLEEN